MAPRLTTPGGRDELLACYRDGLLLDTLPFWLRHSVDREHGGFMFCLDRDGTIIDTDKGVWAQGRFSWLLATLYDQVEARDEWLDLARHGIDFLRRHCFDDDGRMFFQVTRDGRPVRKRRYLFTECFAAAALAAYAKASGEQQARDEAARLFKLIEYYLATPGRIPPKANPTTRAMKGLVQPMIMIATAQILRTVADNPHAYDEQIDRWISEIARDFMKPDYQAVLECVAPDGSVVDHFDGRLLNPGHAIEAGWFILAEARHRDDACLTRIGLQIIDWMWQWGWDDEYGGILYFRDLKNLPVQEYWHDMKFWWPHNEAIIATLMAYAMTGDEKYAHWHEQVHHWAHAHFPDPEHGEWFGYLHRDGRLSVPLKGNLWKGPFHLPRMQLRCWQQLAALAPPSPPR